MGAQCLQGDLREVAPGDLRQDLLDTGGEADMTARNGVSQNQTRQTLGDGTDLEPVVRTRANPRPAGNGVFDAGDGHSSGQAGIHTQ